MTIKFAIFVVDITFLNTILFLYINVVLRQCVRLNLANISVYLSLLTILVNNVIFFPQFQFLFSTF